MDSIRYFDALGIKLDRKTLYIHLKDGKNYIPFPLLFFLSKKKLGAGGVIIFLMNSN